MRIDNQRRSTNVRDRGIGSGGAAGIGGGALMAIISRLGIRGALLVGLVLFGMYYLLPGLRPQMMAALGLQQGVQAEGAACERHAQACDFSAAVLGSTEEIWAAQFSARRLPSYGRQVASYENPTLDIFSNNVETGCGVAPSSVGPFYCPSDRRLYIDPSFYETMRTRLNSPGDFAQAYVIAHEVGHHIQNLIGSLRRQMPGETESQVSVRTELQADCFAGVWGHHATTTLEVSPEDLREALTAAHAIGDDTLQRQGQGYVNPSQFSHGTADQRMRWFNVGFDTGDARECDTFAVPRYADL